MTVISANFYEFYCITLHNSFRINFQIEQKNRSGIKKKKKHWKMSGIKATMKKKLCFTLNCIEMWKRSGSNETGYTTNAANSITKEKHANSSKWIKT